MSVMSKKYWFIFKYINIDIESESQNKTITYLSVDLIVVLQESIL